MLRRCNEPTNAPVGLPGGSRRHLLARVSGVRRGGRSVENLIGDRPGRSLEQRSARHGPNATSSDGEVGKPTAIAVASDSTGTKLVAVGRDIWTSTNGGVGWIDRTPSGPAHDQVWTSIASDVTGMNLGTGLASSAGRCTQ